MTTSVFRVNSPALTKVLLALTVAAPLLDGCTKAVPPTLPTGAELPQPPPTPQVDTRKATYELQQKCAHDAYELYKHEWLEKPQGRLRTISMNYINHYNARLGHCFIDVSFLYASTDKGKVTDYQSRYLIDVLENREIGSALVPMSTHGEAFDCYVADKRCDGIPALAAIHVWEGYEKPYLED